MLLGQYALGLLYSTVDNVDTFLQKQSIIVLFPLFSLYNTTKQNWQHILYKDFNMTHAPIK